MNKNIVKKLLNLVADNVNKTAILIAVLFTLLGSSYSTTEEIHEGLYERYHGYPFNVISFRITSNEEYRTPIEFFPPNFAITFGLVVNFLVIFFAIRIIVKLCNKIQRL